MNLEECLDKVHIVRDRSTLSSDIDILNIVGLYIKVNRDDYKKAYYLGDNAFTVPELIILIDAVQAASFMPEDMSQELIENSLLLVEHTELRS